MRTVLAIAKDQLADLRHRRVIVALVLAAVLFSVVLCLLSVGMSAVGERAQLMSELSEEQRMDLALSTGMSKYMLQTALYVLVFFVGSLLSLITFCGLVSSERVTGSLPWVLSKPITRTQFLMGKWIGACAMALIYAAIMSAVLLGVTWFTERSVPARVSYACMVMPFKFVLLGSVGAFLAALMPPAFAGVLAYFGGAQLFQRIGQWIAPWDWLKAPFTALHYAAPSYAKFNLYIDLMLGRDIPLPRVLLLIAYALAYSAVMLLFTCMLFRRRDVV
jgi:Cu-processing system permease protein